MLTTKPKQPELIGATQPVALGQAIQTLIQVDIPAKGRIAHHIRTGRLQQALRLCDEGRKVLSKKLFGRCQSAIRHELQLLGQIEQLLQSSLHAAH